MHRSVFGIFIDPAEQDHGYPKIGKKSLPRRPKFNQKMKALE
jgi:hypothetical protein